MKACPSCETKPITAESGVCVACTAMYVESLGPDWKNTPTGQFLLSSNQETAQIESGILFAPTGSYLVETLPAPESEEVQVQGGSAEADLDEMIVALVRKHGWGSRRIHAFLSVGGVSVPSLRSVERQVKRLKKEAA